MTEPQVIRRNPRFGSALPQDQMVQKYSRSAPNWYVPFVEDKDYIKADRWDKWVAVAIGVAVLIVVVLDSAWFMGGCNEQTETNNPDERSWLLDKVSYRAA